MDSGVGGLGWSQCFGVGNDVEEERERVQGEEKHNDLQEPRVPSVHGSLSLCLLSLKNESLGFGIGNSGFVRQVGERSEAVEIMWRYLRWANLTSTRGHVFYTFLGG